MTPEAGTHELAALPLAEVVDRAWSLRGTFDLGGVGYGRIHWGNFTDSLTDPFPYYYFLAGMVRLTGAQRVVEVGTHQGGSARAMAAAVAAQPGGRVVTFDVTPFGAELLAGHSVVRAYTCDANSQAAVDLVEQNFGDPRIDLAFIDSAHAYWPTLMSFLIYGEALGARWVVLDDVTLNPEMERLWALIRARYGEHNAIDVTHVHPEIRPVDPLSRPGFGLVRIAPREG